MRAFYSIPCFLLLGQAFGQSLERVNVDAAGLQADGDTFIASMSADGRFIAFDSAATNLVPGDVNGVRDCFVKDRETGAVERVSLSTSGAEADGDSNCPVISHDGRFVVFASFASNLVANDTNLVSDIFLHDRETGMTERCSLGVGDVEADFGSYVPSISNDGRFVAFESTSPNLVPGDTNAATDVFVRDRVAGTTARISVDETGAQASGLSYLAMMSADGRYIAFNSSAPDLVPGDTNGVPDVFRKDLLTGQIERISVGDGGQESAASSQSAAIYFFSADGRFATFDNAGDDLTPGDSNGLSDLYIRDIDAGTTRLVTTAHDGGPSDGGSFFGSIAAGGRYVAFQSDATNLVAGDDNGSTDLFLHDALTGSTTRLSHGLDGVESNGVSSTATIAPDGRIVTFTSTASNLVPSDTNGVCDLFLYRACFVLTQTYGAGHPGSGGYVPLLVGQDGSCAPGGHAIALSNALGHTAGVLFLGGGADDLFPVFGGHFLIDLGLPFQALPVFVPGIPGVPGSGAVTVPGADVSALSGVSLHLQFLLGDPGASQGVAMSNGLTLVID